MVSEGRVRCSPIPASPPNVLTDPGGIRTHVFLEEREAKLSVIGKPVVEAKRAALNARQKRNVLHKIDACAGCAGARGIWQRVELAELLIDRIQASGRNLVAGERRTRQGVRDRRQARKISGALRGGCYLCELVLACRRLNPS